jgi:hypothetical protein
MPKPTRSPKKPLKKLLPETVEAACATYAEVELWSTDEHRIGLQPVLRKVWPPKGQRPHITVQPRYQWLYLCAFVQPQTGRTVWYILPELTTRAFALVLQSFARAHTSPDKLILLVLDQAPWHTSAALRVPEGVQVVFQPAYSPEVQPVEHLWALSDEVIANRCFLTLDDLEKTLEVQCVSIMADPERVKAHTLFHWWPRINE